MFPDTYPVFLSCFKLHWHRVKLLDVLLESLWFPEDESFGDWLLLLYHHEVGLKMSNMAGFFIFAYLTALFVLY